MHITLFTLAGLAAFATALPQRHSFQRPSVQHYDHPSQPGNVLAENLPNGGVSTGDVPNGNVSNGNLPNRNVPTGNIPSGTIPPANLPTENPPPSNNTFTFNPNLVPAFGITAGQNPDGTGNCSGNKGKLIPCACPPHRFDFLLKVADAVRFGDSEGVPVEFPTDSSKESQRKRIQTSIVVLQNLRGRGVGCPAAATTFLEQLGALGS